MDSPLVSVIIPNYNYANYLPEALDSVLNQTYPNIELIVVDDGSSDNSKEVLAPYGGRVVTVFQENQGVSATRNNGVAVSSGELIAFLDADDVWMPTKIEKQVQRFISDATLGLVHVGVEEVDAEGNSLITRLDGLEGRVAGKFLMLKSQSIFGGGSGVMVPRKVFDEVGCFDVRLSTSADWDMFYQISERYTVGFVSEILLRYRVHNSNMHSNIKLMEHDMMLAFQKAFRTSRPDILEAKDRAYGSLHLILAGSYFVAGNYSAFVSHSIKSIYHDRRNIRHFLKFGRRGSNRR